MRRAYLPPRNFLASLRSYLRRAGTELSAKSFLFAGAVLSFASGSIGLGLMTTSVLAWASLDAGTPLGGYRGVAGVGGPEIGRLATCALAGMLLVGAVLAVEAGTMASPLMFAAVALWALTDAAVITYDRRLGTWLRAAGWTRMTRDDVFIGGAVAGNVAFIACALGRLSQSGLSGGLQLAGGLIEIAGHAVYMRKRLGGGRFKLPFDLDARPGAMIMLGQTPSLVGFVLGSVGGSADETMEYGLYALAYAAKVFAGYCLVESIDARLVREARTTPSYQRYC